MMCDEGGARASVSESARMRVLSMRVFPEWSRASAHSTTILANDNTKTPSLFFFFGLSEKQMSWDRASANENR